MSVRLYIRLKTTINKIKQKKKKNKLKKGILTKETHCNQNYIYRVQPGPTGKCLEAKLTIASTWCLFKLKAERIYLFFISLFISWSMRKVKTSY